MSEAPTFSFDAELWKYDGPAGWYFVSLPHDVADELDEVAELKGGFGSIKVEVSLGASRWQTSVFPDKGRGTFLLPVKKSVRSANDVDEGDVVSMSLTPVGP